MMRRKTIRRTYLLSMLLPALALAQTATVTVDATSTVRTVDARTFGVNAVMWDPQAASAQTIALVQAAGTRIIRIPGGSNSDEYDWSTNKSLQNTWAWATGVDSFVRLITGAGTQAFVTTNYGTGTAQEAAAWVAYANADPALLGSQNDISIGVDEKGTDWMTAGYWANIRASQPLQQDDGYNFLRIGHPAPLGLGYWEVGNEVYGSWETDKQASPHDPYTYATRAADYIAKMKAVDPTIDVGVVAVVGEDSYQNAYGHQAVNPRTNVAHAGWTPVMLATLRSLGVTPDFLIYHRYDQNPGQESDAKLLQSSATWPSDAADLRQQLTDYLGAADAAKTELVVTEHNSVSSQTGKQTTSLVNGLFLADSIGNVLQTEFNAFVWWALRNGPGTDASGNLIGNDSASLYGWRMYGDYGMLSTPHAGASSSFYDKYPTYYAMQLVSYFAQGGDTVVRATSSDSLLAAYAVERSSPGSLRLLVINKDPANARSANFALTGFMASGTANVYTYGIANDDAARPNGVGCPAITGSTIDAAGAAFTATFPAYSMSVITLGGPAIALDSSAPAITAQPAPSSVAAGANATFSAAATGCPAPTYQWQREAAGSTTWQDLTESTAYQGVSTATLTVAGATAAMSGDKFRAQASNAAGAAPSNSSMLTVTASTTPAPTPTGKSGGGGSLGPWELAALAMCVLWRIFRLYRLDRRVARAEEPLGRGP